MQKKYSSVILKIVGTVCLLGVTLGCCKPNPVDKFECFNRPVYRLNKAVDRVAVKPIARIYEAIMPKPIQTMVSNFYQNLGEIPNVANDLLQGELAYASSDAARFILNSTWGMAGLFDVAASGKKGIERRNQDFGITLAHWGYKESAYIVLPLLGPSTVRDSLGQVGNYYMDAPTYLKRVKWQNRVVALKYLDRRVSLLKAEPAMRDAIDEYVFVRDAYLQNRQYKIGGGNSTHTPTEAQLGEPPE